MEQFLSRNAHHTKRIARAIFHNLVFQATDRHRPLILALAGDLGSGKTTFIQGLAHALGVRGNIQSPTFVLVKWYEIPARRTRAIPYRHLIHMDAYRIETLAEARRLGLHRLLRDRCAIVVVEWADRIKKLIPRRAVWIRFGHGHHRRERILRIKNYKLGVGARP